MGQRGAFVFAAALCLYLCPVSEGTGSSVTPAQELLGRVLGDSRAGDFELSIDESLK